MRDSRPRKPRMATVDFELTPGDYGVFIDAPLTDEQARARVEALARQIVGDGSLVLHEAVTAFLWLGHDEDPSLRVISLEAVAPTSKGDRAPSGSWRLALEVRPDAEPLFVRLLAGLSDEFHTVVKVDSVDAVAANDRAGGALAPVVR
jgi:hypothetical protein